MSRLATQSLLTSIFVLLFFCYFIFALVADAQVTGSDVVERRAQLEQELANLEKEIAVQQAILQEKQRESVSFERDVTILNAQIKNAELSIQARIFEIRKLESEIGGKEVTIHELSQKIGREKTSLAQLLRRTRELDSYSLIEVVLGTKNLSEFFKDVDDFTSIKGALQESFDVLETTQNQTRKEKDILLEKQIEEEELKKIQELQKQRIISNKAEKDRILKISKGQEAAYQTIIRGIEKSAAAIRTELFALRGTDAIPFEKALEYANIVSQKTGVRPAFVLGVIAHESELGENVGQCLLTNSPAKGDGKGVNTGRIFKHVMKPDRDVDIFINILGRLGLDPFSMVVSCPPSYGYGGAMGPAQFIASTWVLYEGKVADLTGHNPPNPWIPLDAFMASGLLLKDNGAAKGGYQNERLAALRYFAGWTNAANPRYGFYGDAVMELANYYQGLITILQAN